MQRSKKINTIKTLNKLLNELNSSMTPNDEYNSKSIHSNK